MINVLWNGKRTDIEAQMKKLQALRNELQFQIVISIKERVDLADIQRTKEFDALGESLKTLVVSLFDGEGSFNSELQQMRQKQDEIQEGLQGITYILLDHSNKIGLAGLEDPVKRLKERLWFNAMPHRHNDIAVAHHKTFEWIFTGEEGNTTPPSNATFTEWMTNGHGLYWISGRAGTGKSSLMRFLDDDPRTRLSFKTWAGERPLIMAPFYFWNADGRSTDIRLRRLEGLYQGLLHQVLEQAPGLAEHLFPDQINHRDWGSFPTLTDLKPAFWRLLQTETLPVAIGLVVDGLDEYDAPLEDQMELAKILKDAGTKSHLKVVVSSRPELAFESVFECCTRLKLDELTENDRRIYVTDELSDDPRFRALGSSPETRDSLVTQIVDKSEGIFLWVRIAVSAIHQELPFARDVASLCQVIEEMPHGNEGLFDLFDHMLRKRMPPRFQTRGFRMIWTLQECYSIQSSMMDWIEPDWERDPYSLATALLFSFLDDDPFSVKIGSLSISEFRQRLKITTLSLCRNSAGLLETRPRPNLPTGGEAKSDGDLEIHFLHKDVSIFLSQQKQRLFLEQGLQPVKSELHKGLLKSLVMVLKTFDCGSRGRFTPWVLTEASMRVARVVEGHSAEETEKLLDQLDEAMQTHLPYLRTAHKKEAIGLSSAGLLHWVDFFPLDKTHFEPQSYPWPKSDEGYRLDFMCFAIQNGLYHYVRLKMEKGPDVIKRRGLPLLSCACGPVPYWFLLRPSPVQSRTVAMLLLSGANPNEEFRGYSPWQMAMLAALDSVLLNLTGLEELAKVLRLLLEHGANPNAQVKWFKYDTSRKRGEREVELQRSIEDQIRITFITQFTQPKGLAAEGWVNGTYMKRTATDFATLSEDERRKFVKLGEDLIVLVQEMKKIQPRKRNPQAKSNYRRRLLVIRGVQRAKEMRESLRNMLALLGQK